MLTYRNYARAQQTSEGVAVKWETGLADYCGVEAMKNRDRYWHIDIQHQIYR